MHENTKWFKDYKRIASLMQKHSNRVLDDLKAIQDDRLADAVYTDEEKRKMLAEIDELRSLFNEVAI